MDRNILAASPTYIFASLTLYYTSLILWYFSVSIRVRPQYLAHTYIWTRSFCTTFHRYPIFSKRCSVLCKVYTGYCGTSEIEHGAPVWSIIPSLKLGDYLSVKAHKPCSTRGYQKVLSLTWKEPEIWIYSALFFNVVPFQLHTLVPSSFPVINTRSVEVNILVP